MLVLGYFVAGDFSGDDATKDRCHSCVGIRLARNLQDLKRKSACGDLNLDDVSDLLAEQPFGYRSVDGDLVFLEVCLGVRYDVVALLLFLLRIEQSHMSQDLYLFGLYLTGIEYSGIVQLIFE